MEITPAIKSDFLTFDSEQVVSVLIGQLLKYEERQGLVFKKNKYIGVVERKGLLRSRFDTSTAKIGNYIHRTPLVNEHADIIKTAYTMYLSDADFLPVESDKKIIGILRSLDLAALSVVLPETKSFLVSDVKLEKAERLNRNDPIASAAEVMYKKKIEQVAVFDAGKLYGILSFRDLLKKYLIRAPSKEHSVKFDKIKGKSKGAEGEKPNLALLPVGSFSTTDNLTTITGSDKLRDAVALMKKENLSSLIVLDGKEVSGFLTLKNILRTVGSLKIPTNFNIHFIGLNDSGLDAYQKSNIQKISSNEAFKLQREIEGEFSLAVHIKGYSKSQRERKYSVTLRLEFPGHPVTAVQYDWRVETALRKTFDNAKNELAKKSRTDRRKTLE